MAAADEYDDTIQQASREWNVDPILLKSLILQESNGNPRAVSKAGARGLTQLMPDTARALGVTDPHDPVQSIYGGAKYLSEALDAEGHPDKALLYYHGGPGWRRAYGPESAGYVPAVAGHYQRLSQAKAQADSTQPQRTQLAANDTRTATDATPGPAKVTDDEFLQSTGATSKGGKPARKAPEAGGQSDDDFLKATGATAATPTSAPETPEQPPAVSLPGDTKGGQPQPPAPEPTGAARLVPTGGAIPAIGKAASEAYTATPGVLTPEATQWLQQHGVLGQAGLFAARLADTGRADVNALYAGAREAAYQGLSAVPGVGTQGARDIVSIPDAFAGSPHMLQTPRAPEAPGAAPAPAPEPPVALPGVNPLSAETTARATARPAGPTSPVPEVSPQPATATPQSAGAAATSQPIPEKTPGQRLRDLQSSVQQTAEDRAGPGMTDHEQYVKDIPPRMLPSREFSQANSLDHKDAYRNDTAYRAAYDANTKARNEGMVDLLRKDAGDDIALEQAHEARDQVSPVAMGVFEGEKPVDAAGLIAKVDEALASGVQKRSGVATILKDVRDSLHDAEGNPETSPSQLYAARQNITDYLKKGVRGTGDVADNVRAAKSILQGLLPEFDDTIVGGAPKYRDYMKQFAEASRPIDQMEFLQRYQPGGVRKLTDKDGYLQSQNVQKMLEDIYKERRKPGANPAKSLTDEQIQNIINIRNELAAESLQDRLGAVKGSDTSQLLNRAGTLGSGPLGQAIKKVGAAAIHGAIAVKTGGTGNFALKVWQERQELAAQHKAANALAARKAQLLSQPNPLRPP